MFPAAVLAAALLGTPRLCRWAPDVPSDAEPLFDLERSAFGPSNKLSISIRVPVHGATIGGGTSCGTFATLGS